MIKDDLYQIIYKPEEITITESGCRSPHNCTCKLTNTWDCGKLKEDAKLHVQRYYEHRAAAIKEMSLENFMASYGYYYDKEK